MAPRWNDGGGVSEPSGGYRRAVSEVPLEVAVPDGSRRRTPRSGKASRRALKRHSRSKKWLGVITTVVLMPVVAPVVVGRIQTIHLPRSGAPVRIEKVSVQRSDLVGGAWVFRTALKLSPSELAAANDLRQSAEGFDRWARDRGGVDPGVSMVQLVLQGNRRQTARVTNVRVVPRCQEPFSGTLFESPPAGGDDIIKIGFDLDNPHPHAQVFTNSLKDEEYFASKTISLKLDEQQVVVVAATTEHHYCEYTLLVDVLDDGKTVSEQINNNGEPFRVSALLEPNQYGELYMGGVVSPSHNGEFVRTSGGS